MFCYPRGRYDASVVRVVQEAGYWGARTVSMLATRPNFSPFEMPTTLQIFPHPPLTYLKSVASSRSLQSLQTCLLQLPRLGSWLELGKRLFDTVLEKGGIWHLCGHSWEIEKLGLWNDLSEILDYIGRREGVSYVPNCALVPTPLPIAALTEKKIYEDFPGSY
jgi:peptidoglycan/xylan/chitin deacetylase (PgdA/CDA1 family)